MSVPVLWRYWPVLREIVWLAIALSGGALAWLRMRQAYSWPTAEGTIWKAEACQSEGRSHSIKPWMAEITYSYTVNGEYYTGYHRMGTLSEQSADKLIAGWEGRMVLVRYSPKNHGISVLLASDQPGGQLGNPA